MKHLPLFLTALLAAAIPLTIGAETADDEESELNVTAERMEVQIDGKTIELTNNVRFEDDSMVLTADKMLIFLEDEPKEDGKAHKKHQTSEKEDGATTDAPKTQGGDEKDKPDPKAQDEKATAEEAPKVAEPAAAEKKDKPKAEKKDDDMGSMKLKRIEAIGKVELRSKADATQSAAGNSAVYDVKTDSVTLTGDCVITQGERMMKGNEVVFDRKQNKIFVKNADIRIRLKRGSKDKGLGPIFGGKKEKDEKEKAKGAKDEKDEKEKDEKDEK